MPSTLNNTIVAVTGASSGIGEATARVLAEHGATVAVVARRKDRLEDLVAEIAAAGGTAIAVTADIADIAAIADIADIGDRDQAEAAVQTIVDQFGRLDILVNNAGLMLLGTVAEQDVQEWERMIDVNQKGLLYMTKAALPHLLAAAQDGPREVADIVNISSIAGRQAWPKFGAYSMTKFGVQGFTESLRQGVTQKHVRVGLVEPGAVTARACRTSSPPRTLTACPSRSSQSTSPKISPSWSPGRAGPRSPNCGPCPPRRPKRLQQPPGSARRAPPHPTNGALP